MPCSSTPDLALVLFDATHSRDPLGGVEYWLQQLPPRCPTILVAARVDRGSPNADPQRAGLVFAVSAASPAVSSRL